MHQKDRIAELGEAQHSSGLMQVSFANMINRLGPGSTAVSIASIIGVGFGTILQIVQAVSNAGSSK
jgi:hypothetical protein